MFESTSCPFSFPSGEERGFTLHVVLTPSDEVTHLRAEIAALQDRLKALQQEVTRTQNLYQYECLINLELQDLCREYHVPVRDVLKGRHKH